MDSVIDWGKIKIEYVTGRATLKELSTRHKIRYNTLQEHSKEENWREERRKYREKTVKKALARTCARDAQRLARLQRSAMALARDLEKALEDPDVAYRHVGLKEGMPCEELLLTPNGKNVLALARALREATAAVRDLYGINTKAEQAAQDIAAERLDLERRKLELEERTRAAEQTDTKIELIMPPELEELSE